MRLRQPIFSAIRDMTDEPLVEDALSKQMLAVLSKLEAACTAADDLAKAVEERSLSTRTPTSC